MTQQPVDHREDETGLLKTDSTEPAFRREGEKITLHYTLQADDLVAFAQYMEWDSPSRRNLRLLIFIVPLLLALFYFLDRTPDTWTQPSALLFLLLCIATAFGAPYWMRYRIGWRVRRRLRDSRSAGQLGAMRMGLEPAAFWVEGPQGRSERRRGNFLELQETGQHFFFFVQTDAAYPLPKAPFSETEQRTIREKAEYLARGSAR